MKVLRAISTSIAGINFWVGRIASWLTLLAVIIVFTNVVMRYGFHYSNVFMQELEWHLFAMIFLLGAGYTLLKDGHVRVDIFYQRFSPKTQAWINLLGILLFLLPGCYLIIATSLPFVKLSYNMAEISPDPGGIPYRYLLKAIIPVGFMCVVLQGVALLIDNVQIIVSGTEEDNRANNVD
jgi:TRAP-type mannitol/chloroaromatic compound transport system permease small subunit